MLLIYILEKTQFLYLHVSFLIFFYSITHSLEDILFKGQHKNSHILHSAKSTIHINFYDSI